MSRLHEHAPGSSYITDDRSDDGIDRRGFLKCMAWVGTGVVWALKGGVPTSYALARVPLLDENERRSILFAQISDSHIGFAKEANRDVTATLREAVGKLNALPHRPAFVLHTGDITQLSKPGEFDTADQVLRELRTERVLFVPGEHDVLNDNGASYLERYGKSLGTRGGGWYSFEHSGVHFVGLVNVLNLKAGGLGSLGTEQLAWLRRDVADLPASTPIVVFAHVPLWTIYPEWGWGTDDAAQALALLRRFGSVTVLNGHIHQIMQKVEGHVSFHTAMSTAFPQPAPGTAPAPGPLTVAPERLRSVLGVRDVSYVPGRGTLAITDETLSGLPPAFAEVTRQSAGTKDRERDGGSAGVAAPNEIRIDNFSFVPRVLTVARGTQVTWVNADDVPHLIVSVRQRFAPSSALDTGQRYSVRLTEPGTYDYFCSIHPTMTGRIVVQ